MSDYFCALQFSVEVRSSPYQEYLDAVDKLADHLLIKTVPKPEAKLEAAVLP